MDGKFAPDNARTFSGPTNFRHRESDPVNFLSAGFGAKFAVSDEHGARLGNKHSAALAPDHLSRPDFVRR